MGRPAHTATQEARYGIQDYIRRNPGARIPMERGEWRILQSTTRNDGGIFLLGIYRGETRGYATFMQRSADGLREAVRKATGRLTIVEILFEEVEDGDKQQADKAG